MYRPAGDRWSIHEIILHLADSEAEGYIRCRQFIAEPGSAAVAHDTATWVSTLGYFHQSTREALGLISRLRRMTHQILLYLPASVWSNTVQNLKRGTMSLDDWLEWQARHIPHHVEQIQKNYAAWAKLHPGRKPPSRLVPVSPDRQVVLGALRRSADFAD